MLEGLVTKLLGIRNRVLALNLAQMSYSVLIMIKWSPYGWVPLTQQRIITKMYTWQHAFYLTGNMLRLRWLPVLDEYKATYATNPTSRVKWKFVDGSMWVCMQWHLQKCMTPFIKSLGQSESNLGYVEICTNGVCLKSVMTYVKVNDQQSAWQFPCKVTKLWLTSSLKSPTRLEPTFNWYPCA